jgi:hypothetical protein
MARKPRKVDVDLVDPAALYLDTFPELRERIGQAAIAMVLGQMGCLPGMQSPAHETAESEALWQLVGLVRRAADEQTSNARRTPLGRRVDLNAIGIRMCLSCGCTDRHACRPACWWKGPMQCSSCPEPVQAR